MINPPAAWPRGIVVNKHGARICHEGVYGSTLGDAVAHSPDGVAFLIIDEVLHRQGCSRSAAVPSSSGISARWRN